MSDAESHLRNLLGEIALERNFGDHELIINSINSGGANYTSVLFLVTVKRPNKTNVELFAKVACIGDRLREIMDAKRLYYLEAYFYQKLTKVYKALELKGNLADEDRFLIPKFYGCNSKLYEETVVLENLVALGYGTYSRFISVDWDHAASSIETLAKLHALSFAYQKENPEEFENVCKDIVFVEKKQDENENKTCWEKIVERGLKVVKEEHRPKILKFLENLGDTGIYKFRKPLGTRVIVHGDFRPSNMMYKKIEDKVDVMVVDYQTIHIGTPAADFVYFLLCGTDSRFRAENYDRLVDHYYTELCAALQRLGVDANEVYPREVWDSELNEMLPQLVALGLFLLPVVLVETEQAPRVDGDGGMEIFSMPSNDLFAQRYSGIVEDCVSWGFL